MSSTDSKAGTTLYTMALLKTTGNYTQQLIGHILEFHDSKVMTALYSTPKYNYVACKYCHLSSLSATAQLGALK